jgi:hypothetical protein
VELPRAAITTLDLTLPPDVKDVRFAGKSLTDPLLPSPLTFKGGQLAGPLGSVDKLDIKWRKPGAAANMPPVLESVARIVAQFDDRETRTTAELTLKAEGTPAVFWQLLVPLDATVKLAKEDEGRLQNPIQVTKQKIASQCNIRLKEAVNELNVIVTVRGPQPVAGTVAPIGPFLLMNSPRQRGTILVMSNLQDVKLQFHPHGELQPRELTDEEQRRRDPLPMGAFRYESITAPEKPAQITTGAQSHSLLDVEPQSTRGLVQTHITHELRLVQDQTRGRVWRLKTTIDAIPFRTGVDHLDVQLPVECTYNEQVGPKPASLVAAWDSNTHLLRLKLAADPLKQFQVTFESDYVPAVADSGKATLALPKPLDTRDRGGQVTVLAPDDIELLAPDTPSPFDPGVQEPQQQVWRSARLPERIEVRWQPYRPEVRALSSADLTLNPREGKVRQELRLQFPRAATPQVLLRVPEAIADSLRVVRGGTAGSRNNGTRLIKLDAAANRENVYTLVLDYTFKMPKGAEILLVPLATPEQVASDEAKVRVLCDGGLVPSLESQAWSETEIEAIPQQPRLPALVVRTSQLDAPLTLRLVSSGKTAGSVLVDRVLVRVEVEKNGVQKYRVSYLLMQLAAGPLEIEFPAPVPSLNLNVKFDGEAIPAKTVEESGQRADGNRIARLQPELLVQRKPVVLEISYQLQAQRTGSGTWQTTFQPPLLRGDTSRPPTRWQVTLSDEANLVILGPEGGPGAEPVWGRRGWLFGPHVGVTATDLERWLDGRSEPQNSEDAETLPLAASCSRSGVEPLTLVHAPQRTWLLSWSLAFLALGFVLFLVAQRTNGNQTSIAPWFWVFAALVIVVAVVGLLLWPTLSSAILFGCLPGAVMLLLAIGIHVLLQERRRRQIVFLPSFRRSSSSLVRGSASRLGEPSTVDAPRPSGSQWPTGEILHTDSHNGSKSKREG